MNQQLQVNKTELLLLSFLPSSSNYSNEIRFFGEYIFCE